MTAAAMFRALLLALLLGVAASAAAAELPAQAAGADDGEEPRLEARLWVDPLGDRRFRVGVELIPDPGWHTYGEEPGDVGLPPVVRWLPEGDPEAVFGELSFPVAETFVDEELDLVSYGYERPVLLATHASTSRDVVPLVVEVEALVCAYVCLPATFRLGGELRDGAAAPLARARFDAEAAGIAPPTATRSAGAGPWLHALLLGFLGGILLNAMPCVLPVLAVKLAALASLAHGSRRERSLHAGAYIVGISLSMLALAGAVLGLRAAGHAVGWGFQLQEPTFLVALCCLVLTVALNLFGVFDVDVDTGRLAGLGSETSGSARSFMDGLLAVALATPCTAPFLGTAVGLAFASPAPLIVTIFLSIGLGLAAPFALAAAFPGWARFVPRSGAWMHDLRAVLGFSMLLTAVALLWVLGRASGSGAMSAALLLMVGVAGAIWLLGTLQKRARRVPVGVFALVVGGIAVAGITGFDWSPPEGARSSAPQALLPGAREFRSETLAEGLRDGRPAFVYFTADWCVTCKVNERTVLADPRVADELERLGYDVYRADWTRRDEHIRAALAELGKAGVPVYALWPAGGETAPRLLPELLTVGSFLEATRQVASNREL